MIQLINVLDSVTANTTAPAESIEGAKKVMLICKRAGSVGGGSSAFSATVSVDGTNYITYNKWIRNLANTIDQTLTRVASLTLTTDVADFITMSPEDAYLDIKVSVAETTAGTHSAWLMIEY